MLTVLDNSIWIPDGKVAEKQIYVLAGPCCGISQDFYLHSRNVGDKVQFQWVETPPSPNAKCLGYLAESAMGKDPHLLLQHMYQSMAAPSPVPATIRENAIRWNRAVEFATNGMRQKLDAMHNPNITYPILIWLSDEGVKVAVEPSPRQLAAIVDSVVARPEAAHLTPASRKFLIREYKIEPMPAVRLYAKEDGVRLFALPDPDSQPLFALAKNEGPHGAHAMGQVNVNGETWFELPASSTETWVPGFFVRADQVYQAH